DSERLEPDADSLALTGSGQDPTLRPTEDGRDILVQLRRQFDERNFLLAHQAGKVVFRGNWVERGGRLTPERGARRLVFSCKIGHRGGLLWKSVEITGGNWGNRGGWGSGKTEPGRLEL